jgi:ATP-dependent phosphofructokinase / diphosphate-dependent phosphofructokinase
MDGTLLVGQAGGATAVINSTLAGILDEARHGRYSAILGMRRAAEGALREEFVDLSGLSGEDLEALAATPGAALASSRHRVSDDDLDRLLDICRRRDVRTFLYIGGNDSADTTHRLAERARRCGYDLRAIAVPKTIDNDLPETDHCPGYGSIARYVAIAAMDSSQDTRSMPTMYPIKVIEVMGRDAGWVAAAAALAKQSSDDAPQLVYLPERPVSLDRVVSDLERVYRSLGWVVLVVPETLRDSAGNPFADPALSTERDAFGHPLLRGTADTICRIAQRELGLRARFDKPGSLQRMSMFCASSVDLAEAREVGREAVRCARRDITDVMVTLHRASGEPYASYTGTTALANVANRQRLMPDAFIAPNGTDITEGFRRYALPLLGPNPFPRYFHLPG